ncbi:FadR/GntR family transcriptional regulator [Actinomadura rupiterrae]|uniref:FadR/GntR family transcriptional regulator n=1 Tax=Actinomadura rupiterrae TaxID=559627 RepID=UPI0020A33201|nr:FadR/GntR family transcriptional regulator [Actinomadura rupiterrae]MCP2339103.1 DNA-binding FadR family transcriptional regulator [Actinomadura rupiterrae]
MVAPARTSVTEDTIERIKAMIARGEFAPGERLPTERELVVRLGVSRSSLREAIRALTLVGVLEARQGDGTYVTSLAPHLLLDAVATLVELSPDATALELLAVRRVLEAAAAAQAASRITAVELAELARCLEVMRHDPHTGDGDLDEAIAADLRFHEIMVRASGNAVLAAFCTALGSRTLRARVKRGRLERGVFGQSLHEHEAIYEALHDRDPSRAAAVAASHIASVEAFVRHAPVPVD